MFFDESSITYHTLFGILLSSPNSVPLEDPPSRRVALCSIILND